MVVQVVEYWPRNLVVVGVRVLSKTAPVFLSLSSTFCWMCGLSLEFKCMIGHVLEEMQPCLGAQSPSAKRVGSCFVMLLYKTCDSRDYIIDIGFCTCRKRTMYMYVCVYMCV